MALNASEQEVKDFLDRHLRAIAENDFATYRETTDDELSLYEWWVTPHRIDGLDFHNFIMNESARRRRSGASPGNQQIELANLRIQRHGNSAVVSYTLMLGTGHPEGVKVATHNESRVLLKRKGKWSVIHVHKSPAWQAPHMPPPPCAPDKPERK